jgi:hypothetical protein
VIDIAVPEAETGKADVPRTTGWLPEWEQLKNNTYR